MTRIGGDMWIYPDGKKVVVQPGELVAGAKLYYGYDYENQFWVKKGEPQHHALCGELTKASGRTWNGPCNVCEYLKNSKNKGEK